MRAYRLPTDWIHDSSVDVAVGIDATSRFFVDVFVEGQRIDGIEPKVGHWNPDDLQNELSDYATVPPGLEQILRHSDLATRRARLSYVFYITCDSGETIFKSTGTQYFLPRSRVVDDKLDVIVGYDQVGYFFADLMRGTQRVGGTEFGIGVQLEADLVEFLSEIATIPDYVWSKVRQHQRERTLVSPRIDGLGRYQWGNGRVELSRAANVDHRKVMALAQDLHSLSKLFRGGGSCEPGGWDDYRAVRGFASLAHELTHLYQDLSTGLGHWDSTFRTVHRMHWIGARTPPLPWPTPAGPIPAFGTRCNGEISEQVIAMAGELSSVNQVASVDEIIEAEAVATTLLAVLAFESTPRTNRYILENIEILHPMRRDARLYRLVFDLFLSDFEQRITGLRSAMVPPSLDHPDLIARFMRLIVLACDISLSVPPPRPVDQQPLQLLEHHPSVRFAKLRKTLNILTPSELARLWDSLSSTDLTESEELLSTFTARSNTELGTRQQIYLEWGRTMLRHAPRYPDYEKALWEVRLNSTEFRLAHPSLCFPKLGLFGILPCIIDIPQHEWDDNLDLQFNSQDQLNYSMPSLRRACRSNAAIDELRDFSDGLTSVYSCPFAGQHVYHCRARESECWSGWSNLEHIPDSTDCHLRTNMRSIGITLDELGGRR